MDGNIPFPFPLPLPPIPATHDPIKTPITAKNPPTVLPLILPTARFGFAVDVEVDKLVAAGKAFVDAAEVIGELFPDFEDGEVLDAAAVEGVLRSETAVMETLAPWQRLLSGEVCG